MKKENPWSFGKNIKKKKEKSNSRGFDQAVRSSRPISEKEKVFRGKSDKVKNEKSIAKVDWIQCSDLSNLKFYSIFNGVIKKKEKKIYFLILYH